MSKIEEVIPGQVSYFQFGSLLCLDFLCKIPTLC